MSFLGIFKSSIIMPRGVYEEIINHARESYPEECCGVLIGATYKDKRVFEVQRAKNTNTERARDRYIIDPRELNFIDKVARTQGLDVIGFYHSHPDHPDKPSQTDRELGQPGYSYIIASVKKGKDVSLRSWIFEEADEPFKEEKIKVGNY
ncbi:MAG: M67 family metallopeptidase [Deltaproteobacteria bacterium]|nr:M67 family metallopeptidase [Deltaproteobacteria bacterium]